MFNMWLAAGVATYCVALKVMTIIWSVKGVYVMTKLSGTQVLYFTHNILLTKHLSSILPRQPER